MVHGFTSKWQLQQVTEKIVTNYPLCFETEPIFL